MKEELFRLSRENMEWFKENYENLKRKHDGHWVIVQDKKVVQSADTFDEVMNLLKGFDPNRVVVEYIESKPIAMFF